MAKLNYEEDIVINPDELDVEWVLQPQKFGDYCKALAEAERTEDIMKDNLAVVRAEIDLEIRKTAEKKPTEGEINSMIILDKRFAKANDEYIEAKHASKIMQGAVRAFDQRKVALENLVMLEGRHYFAGPKEPRELASELSKRNKDTKQEMARTRVKQAMGK